MGIDTGLRYAELAMQCMASAGGIELPLNVVAGVSSQTRPRGYVIRVVRRIETIR